MKYVVTLLAMCGMVSCHKCYQCQLYITQQQIEEQKVCTGDATYDKARKGEAPYNYCTLVE